MNTFAQGPGSSARRRSPRFVRLLSWLAASLFCLSTAQSAPASEQSHVTPEQAYQMALEARSGRDYPAMLSLLREAGGAGYLAAQELLGSVLLTGDTLYGTAVQANPCEAAYWIRQATAGGSDVAVHQTILLNGLRDLPKGRDSCVAKAG